MKNINTFKHFLIAITFILSILLIFQPSRLFFDNLNVGEVSNKDVIAPQTITYVDEEATEELKQQLLKEVDSVYDKDSSVLEGFIDSVDLFNASVDKYKKDQVDFNQAKDNLIKEYDEQESKKEDLSDLNESEDKEVGEKLSLEKELKLLRSNFMTLGDIINPFDLEKELLSEILELESVTLERFFNYIKNEISLLYKSGLTEDQLDSVKEILLSDSNLYMFPDILRDRIYDKVLDSLTPNLVFNEKETEDRKEEVLKDLEPIYKKVVKGEAVIRKYEEIKPEDIQKLEILGLINKKFDFTELFESFFTLLIITILFHLYCNRFLTEKMISLRKYSITYLIFALTILFANLLQGTDWELIPVLTLLIVTAVFWPKSFIFVTTFFIGIIISISNGDFLNLLLIMLSGLSLVVFYKSFKNFTDAIRNGLYLGIALAISSVVLHYAIEQRFVYYNLVPLVLSGVFSGIIANGIIPLKEKLIGMATVYKLTELNKYDHYLLEELYNRAKGTYDHSRNVSHLVTMASNRIGTNTLLLKVAALYHDIGKMDEPEYFIENSSPEENIHNKISPLKSAEKILNHSIRSAELCKEHKIPEEVIETILPHHGDSVLTFFYNKAVQMGLDVSEDDFKYNTPPPVTKEQSILLLADSIEAYSRSIDFDNYDELKAKISKFVQEKINSGVLRKSQLTLKEIDICIDEFCRALLATHHKRISYKP